MYARFAPADCVYCKQPLTALQRVRGRCCDKLRCRHSHADDQRAAARSADLASRRARAARAWAAPALAQLAVVWLQPHRTRLVGVSAVERDRQRAYLEALASGRIEAAALAPPQDLAAGGADDSAVPGRVCAFCGGRCCRHGAFTHAFIDRRLLRRWVDAHPGSTLHDAAAAYAGRLPQQHVEGSCLHHGRDGCTLTREMRSDICNRHACDGLVDARQRLAEGAPDGLVVAMPAATTVDRAAWVGETATRRLTRRP